ncbi:MAG: SGNH/GDSL hydrolase family protein [Clostridia bacterium]|nr:SGNH/GDSL hydrolase family protein [Clostridia bacterium]
MKILFYGDSITDDSRNREIDFKGSSYGFGYVRAVAGKLLSENPLKYEIYNRGISGNRITDLYSRVKIHCWNLEPDVLSILIGVNDVWHEFGGGRNGVDIKRFEKVYRMLLEDTKEVLPNVKILLIEPFILQGSATQAQWDLFLQVKDYAKVVEKLAKEYDTLYMPLQEKFDQAAAQYGAQAYLADGVHPTVAGAQLIADEWIKIFKREIDK